MYAVWYTCWTLGALVVSYVVAVIAGFLGAMDMSALSRMILGAALSFIVLEIVGANLLHGWLS